MKVKIRKAQNSVRSISTVKVTMVVCAGLFGGPGPQRSDPGMVPGPQFAASAAYVGPRPAR